MSWWRDFFKFKYALGRTTRPRPLPTYQEWVTAGGDKLTRHGDLLMCGDFKKPKPSVESYFAEDVCLKCATLQSSLDAAEKALDVAVLSLKQTASCSGCCTCAAAARVDLAEIKKLREVLG